MTNNKAQEIIERAMRDRMYDAMAARESEVGSLAARKPMKNWR